jgi:arsenite methyltransferase
MSVADDSLKTLVKEKYGRAAAGVRAGSATAASCCGPSATSAAAASGATAASGAATSAAGCGCGCGSAAALDPISSNLYGADETAAIPDQALRASLGCGNPTALAELRPGEVVLDLGSGGGIDVLLSARRVGPTGKAYGLDMTDEMLALARDNQRQAGVDNVEFLRGEMEAIPLPDAAVDVIISNCVINLSGDKRRVLAEAFRVLRPGGRFAVSDVVVRGSLPPAVRRSMELWVGCVAGALGEEEFKALLSEIGFEDPEIEPTRIYRLEDAREVLAGAGLDADALAAEVDGRVMGAFVRARKPAAAG